MIPNRLSYFFNFQGRSLSVDTACSSSLQALDLVVEGLQHHKSEMGLVIGTNFMASVDTNITFQITASDVLHNFAMPSFGLKLDAVPGRLNEIWTYVPAEYAGQTFYGQCSELCGTGHAYMPIMVKMVTKEEFAAWAEQALQEYGQVDEPAAVKLAASAADPVTPVAD